MAKVIKTKAGQVTTSSYYRLKSTTFQGLSWLSRLCGNPAYSMATINGSSVKNKSVHATNKTFFIYDREFISLLNMSLRGYTYWRTLKKLYFPQFFNKLLENLLYLFFLQFNATNMWLSCSTNIQIYNLTTFRLEKKLWARIGQRGKRWLTMAEILTAILRTSQIVSKADQLWLMSKSHG